MRRIDQIEPFRVMQLLERAKELEAEGQKIIHMEIGEPDFPTPPSVIEAAKAALDSGDNYYTPSTGNPKLQKALSQWYLGEYGVAVAPERILITPGTSGAFSLIYATLLEAGESVLLSDPGYPCQRNFIRLAGGEPLNIPVSPETRYHLSAGLIEHHWKAGTRAAVVINPSNPTGTLIDDGELKKVADSCRRLGGYLISDEIYHGLTYGAKARCALEFSDDAIIVNGFSKRWAMTGWRIGWVIVPDSLIDACRRVMQNIFIAAPTLSQYAAIRALAASDEIEVMRRAYDERRSYLLSELPKLGFDIVVEPQGAFYIYANVSRLTDDSRSFCWQMLEKAGVAITPGEDFGSYRSDQHVRFSYATGLEDIREGVDRIRRYLSLATK
ncbi:Aspartate/methionine/tyrosine aminotransferase [Mariprofundus ferrinatatus]|uniref:Aminotransferase n=1 Tax=Mariprofundus ferrinatatus TaxID=1921087 RepID=A0A2K8L6S9_9PROT|nr:aminotransferase class I/II-fold pyridoxal phosphate-dependent enzyme [Mariprofundus ferrinatatus]ATX83035.1 Aspartate/methionine/tyrosine aminotransferase [Mariprofundus ferrinatatus]